MLPVQIQILVKVWDAVLFILDLGTASTAFFIIGTFSLTAAILSGMRTEMLHLLLYPKLLLQLLLLLQLFGGFLLSPEAATPE